MWLKRAEAGLTVPSSVENSASPRQRSNGPSSASWSLAYGSHEGLEEENRRLRKMYLEAKIKAEIVSEVLAKSDEAISLARDGRLPPKLNNNQI